MNLYKEFNTKEKELIGKIQEIENRDYTVEEVRRVENKILEEIMSNSKKDIGQARKQYDEILYKLERYKN